MKAILVIDMPDDMQIKETKALHITLTNDFIVREMDINTYLRPMPQRLRRGNYEDGFNDCIGEILGETE